MSRLEPKLQRSLGISMGAHAAMLICAVWLARQAPATPPAATERVPSKLIYFERSGPMGGGGGTSQRAAPAKLEIPRQQPPPPVTAVPVQTVEPPPPVPTLKLQVQTDAASVLRSPGTNISLPPGRAGGGKGTGVGEGDGPGLNKGTGGEQGGGPMLPGGDVTSPDVLKEIRPAYTSGALAAKLQGIVELEIVVRADGSVGDVKITRSLDRVYGLDLEAIKAARQWVFRPGTHKGKPVDVIARLQLQFRIF